ncbi:tRNA (N(6)-L-threonylcarbamoyladenosine(37)-C(2))-methylthiotransferase MtaB [Campylobacter hepaticus]|uniref:tRNA (N(6)-L-threonylcarbamoyladenosine(37)-C(2))-methylthiotransferase MtaB n=1 Tax=Campylobacter hepaticus TaxID=1813019 RepID=A0A424Z036_9BACT|nr:tRNA (N(6)-L-threonylcarbamoyladenosine(37)-C(2))-methylthiotransferase MtaB [Campylobacter hepaticus]AXP08494.1 tRNA (N(6)-L-threonylcarbamoyladenosine(37)-C(2))-methylthiotransferase MtaB [Campylobacter hepaticus]MCZ0772330.1 tRNA (N(6)-L-threonylcarbamoyladenosine(37)-C(2))-methylthiotransferase MtaB [Campylobacter hepaticus]MCZ0773798.1 tRNA (N(6)-L-threonylcarbamoyladenosine(37)-C(2))-methylthiotransferase MtaB [Campylobacter hepaticus]MCZ0775049.1 tRNA (N(6)-L-threonylcarbamoyladenosin
MKEKVFFKTFGCRTNIYDTELLKTYIKDYEITNDENMAQIIVVNSCTVTNGADSGIKSYINTMQKKGIKIILTGCGAQSKGKELLNNKQVFGVFGASNKHKINDFLGLQTNFYEPGDLNFIDKDIVYEYKNHTKAFVKIQEGCDFACSYCIIPSVRGKSRSVDESVLLKQVEILGEKGYSEIVLTGTNIGSYGLKKGTSLGKLLQKMGKISSIKRIRLGSLEPAQIDESFLEILNEPWLERHLHIALQHTSEKMLRIMRRRSHTSDDLKLFNTIASKGYALGTDFIVGHPGENEVLWKEALEHFKAFPLTHIHAFIFSPRNNTHSATMTNTINGALAKERLNTLKTIVDKNNYEFRCKNRIPLEILIENKKEDFFEGYDQFFNKIKLKSDHNIIKKWITLSEYEVQEKFNFANLKG